MRRDLIVLTSFVLALLVVTFGCGKSYDIDDDEEFTERRGGYDYGDRASGDRETSGGMEGLSPAAVPRPGGSADQPIIVGGGGFLPRGDEMTQGEWAMYKEATEIAMKAETNYAKLMAQKANSGNMNSALKQQTLAAYQKAKNIFIRLQESLGPKSKKAGKFSNSSLRNRLREIQNRVGDIIPKINALMWDQ